MSESGTQVCRKCKTEKPLIEFPRNKHVIKGDHPGIDPMCKACWKDGRKNRQAVVADAKEQGVAVPKRSRKAAAASAEGSENEAPSSEGDLSFSSSYDSGAPEDTTVVDPAKVVPTITRTTVNGIEIDVINNPTKPVLNKKQWYRGLIGPFEDVVKFFVDVFGRNPETVVKHKNTYYFPMTDEEAAKVRKVQ